MDVIGSVILGPLAGGAFTVGSNWLYRRLKQRNQRALLSFQSNRIAFVYPPRRDTYSQPDRVILPRTATEDFLAINNVISALLKAGWEGELDMCAAKDFNDARRQGDAVLICSPVSNPATRSVLDLLFDKYPQLPRFETDADGHSLIRAGARPFESQTYEVVAQCRAAGTEPEEATMRDHGLLIKAPNPWNPQKLVFVLAGIRGIATWGIAECLKKDWQQIFRRKRRDGNHSASGPFAAVLEVTFEKCDLKPVKVVYMDDLD